MPLSGNKVTAFTFRHQDQADKPGYASSAAFKQALDSQAAQLQTGLNGLIDALLNALAGTSGAEQMGSAPIPGVNGSTPYAQLADIKAQLNGVVLGQIPDGTITAAKLANDVMTIIERSPQLVSLERVQANLVAIAEINAQSIPQSGYGYDLFRGASLNLYSCAILDTFATNVAATIAAGATSVTLPTVAGLAAGREITLQDIVTESKRERLVIASIVGNAVTFTTPTVNAYAAQAKLYRSLGKVDTVARKLLFGGASYQASQLAASTVVASAFDTSGNGGRKVVQLSNGWLVAAVYDSTATQVKVYKSTDNGNSWVQLCYNDYPNTPDIALVSTGTIVKMLTRNGAVIKFNSFDATTQTNVDIQSSQVGIDAQVTGGAGVSLALDGTGALHAVWCIKITTLPNSFNICYSKSTDGGVTWAAPTQLTTLNTAGWDDTNPCVVVKSNGYPMVFYQYANTTAPTYRIRCQTWSGTAWNLEVEVYNPGTGAYQQQNPCAAIAPNGRIWCAWHGMDATDTTKENIRVSYSDDGGATWSAMQKLTTGNTYAQVWPSVNVDKNNNVYVLWVGIDPAIWTVGNQLRKAVWNGTWGSATSITAVTSGGIGSVSSLDNNTLDFSDPLAIYKDGQAAAVKFRGTWVTTTTLPLTQEDIRYNITPPTGLMDELRSWMQYDDAAGFTVTSAVSIVDTAANESFADMTATIDDYGTYKETYFNGFVAAVQEKGAQRITMNRASVSDSVAVTKYLAAVIGG